MTSPVRAALINRIATAKVRVTRAEREVAEARIELEACRNALVTLDSPQLPLNVGT